MGPTLVPGLEVATLPCQPSLPVPPPAVQEAALVLLQLSVVEAPVWIAAGEAVNEPIVGGTGAVVAVRLAELGALLPPGPLHVNV